MADTVELHGKPVPTKDDLEFVTDLARFAEALVSAERYRNEYRFGNEVWDKLGNDDELLRAVEAEKLRRIRSGESSAIKESAPAAPLQKPLGSWEIYSWTPG